MNLEIFRALDRKIFEGSLEEETSSKVEDAKRLHAEGLSVRDIAEKIGVPKSTVSDYLKHPEMHHGVLGRHPYLDSAATSEFLTEIRDKTISHEPPNAHEAARIASRIISNPGHQILPTDKWARDFARHHSKEVGAVLSGVHVPQVQDAIKSAESGNIIAKSTTVCTDIEVLKLPGPRDPEKAAANLNLSPPQVPLPSLLPHAEIDQRMAEVEAHYDKMSIRTQKRSKYTYLKAKESSLSSEARRISPLDALIVEKSDERTLFFFPYNDVTLKPSQGRKKKKEESPTVPPITLGSTAKFLGLKNAHELYVLLNGEVRDIRLDNVLDCRVPISVPSADEMIARNALFESLIAKHDVGGVVQLPSGKNNYSELSERRREALKEKKEKKERFVSPSRPKKRKIAYSASLLEPKKKKVRSDAPQSTQAHSSVTLSEKVNFHGTEMSGFVFLATKDFADQGYSIEIKPPSSKE